MMLPANTAITATFMLVGMIRQDKQQWKLRTRKL